MEATVTVKCGQLVGVLLREDFSAIRDCISCAHGLVKPRQFEILGGRAASKSWKRSIRTENGKTLWWMVQSGKLHLYDEPLRRPPRPKSLPPRLIQLSSELPTDISNGTSSTNTQQGNAEIAPKVRKIKRKLGRPPKPKNLIAALPSSKENMNILNVKPTPKRGRPFKNPDTFRKSMLSKRAKSAGAPLNISQVFAKNQPFKDPFTTNDVSQNQDRGSNQLTLADEKQGTAIKKRHRRTHKAENCSKGISTENVTHSEGFGCRKPNNAAKLTDTVLPNASQESFIKKRRKRLSKVEQCLKATIISEDSVCSDLNHGPVIKKRHRRTRKQMLEDSLILSSNLIADINTVDRKTSRSTLKRKRYRINHFEKGLNAVVSSESLQTVLHQTCIICGTKLNDSNALSYHDILFHSAVSSKIFNNNPPSEDHTNSDSDQYSVNAAFLELSDIGSRECEQISKSVSRNENASYLKASGLIGHTLTRGTLAKLTSIGVHAPLDDCIVEQKSKIPTVDIQEHTSRTVINNEVLSTCGNTDVACSSSSSVIANIIKQYKEVLDLSKEALEGTASLMKRLGDITEMIQTVNTDLNGVSESLELCNLSKLLVRNDVSDDDFNTFSKILEKLTDCNQKPK